LTDAQENLFQHLYDSCLQRLAQIPSLGDPTGLSLKAGHYHFLIGPDQVGHRMAPLHLYVFRQEIRDAHGHGQISGELITAHRYHCRVPGITLAVDD